MFVLVAIDAKQFPVAAIERIVVVIVIFMVHCQFAQAHTGEFATAATADVWIDFERPIAIRCFALAAVPARFGYDAVEPRLIGDGRLGHGGLIAGVTGRNESTVPVAHCTTGTVRLYFDSSMVFRLSSPARYAPSMKPMTSSSFILPSELFRKELRHWIIV